MSTLLDNLIAWYACNEANDTDDFADSHTGGRTLTQVLNPGVTTGGRTFNGTGNRASSSDSAFNPGTSDFTIAMRFRSSSLASAQNIFGKGATGVGAGVAEGYRTVIGSTGVLSAVIGSGTTTTIVSSSAGAVLVDTDYIVIVAYDRDANVTAWLNNSQVLNGSIASRASDDLQPAAVYNIGSTSTNAGGFAQFFPGTIYFNGFWNRLLTSDERTELYNGGSELAYPETTSIITTPQQAILIF